jgi:cyclopropane fatty-acyl-phospholipid synthase-like methyltransferase
MDLDFDIFLEIHKDMPRQGAGRNKYTQKAYEMIPKINQPRILDIGCGPGMQTIKLAKLSDGKVIGIDIFQQYLEQLQKLIDKEKLQNRVKAVKQSMFEIKYPEEYFDIIWAEGSIFIIGFEKGLNDWKKHIKPNGYLAVHEMAWLKDNPPKELLDYWKKIYPAISTVDQNIKIIEKSGYKLLGHFALPEDAWWELYYNPLEKHLKELEPKYKNNTKVMNMIQQEYREIEMFRKYNDWYGSVFYIMQKI